VTQTGVYDLDEQNGQPYSLWAEYRAGCAVPPAQHLHGPAEDHPASRPGGSLPAAPTAPDLEGEGASCLQIDALGLGLVVRGDALFSWSSGRADPLAGGAPRRMGTTEMAGATGR
jgi:hypothetical protein